jgi:hypothetical protein
VDGRDVPAGDMRACTRDFRTHDLAPGESRAETIPWSGLAQLGGPSEPYLQLPPGRYEVRGAAHPLAVGDPVLVELRADG